MEKYNTDLVALIREAHQANMRCVAADSVALGKTAGEDRVNVCIQGIVSKYDVLLSHVKHQLRALRTVSHSKLDKAQLQEESEESTERIRQTSEEGRILRDRKLRLEPMQYDWQSYNWRLVVEALFFVCEISINAYGTSVLGGSLLVGIIIACVIALSLCVVAVFIGIQYKEKQGEERKAFVKKAVMCMTVVFLCLSILRSLYAFSHGEMRFSVSVAGGTAIYLTLNILIFFAGCVFSTTLATGADKRLKHQHDELNAKLAQCRSVIETERALMKSRREESERKARARIDNAADAKYYADLINGYKNEAIQAFYRQRDLTGADDRRMLG